MNIELLNGDCLVLLEKIDDNSIDSIITDPPYEIGFMGKKWDNSGIAYNIELWKECLRVLKPGGYLLSFSSTRTYHRMAVAIEDAGFEIRDMIEYVYGTGFPKSLDVGKAIDKLQGKARKMKGGNFLVHEEREETDEIELTKGTSAWEGFGTALKPSHEPICMARKPLSEKNVAENCLKWNTGAINIQDCRIGEESIKQLTDVKSFQTWREQDGRTPKDMENKELSYKTGRFPANLILDNTDEVKECFPYTISGGGNKSNKSDVYGQSQVPKTIDNTNWESNSGSATRFFKTIIYEIKPSKKEKGHHNNHPTVKPIKLMEYLILMVTPENGIVLDPFLGSGTTGVAAINMNKHFIGMELNNDYLNIAQIRIDEVLKHKSEELF